jgi:hypothetical protein
MIITIRIEKNYGLQTIYPVCEQSQLLAKLAGTKTITAHALETIRALGYEIQLKENKPKEFAHLLGA